MQNGSNDTASLSDYQIKQLQSLYLNAIVNAYSSQIMICIGVVSLLSALIAVAVILSSKKLRIKSYFLLVGAMVGDAIENFTYIRIGVLRLIAYSHNQPMVYTQLQCFVDDFPRAVAPSLSKGFYCLCAMDRFIAVYKPVWYNTSYPSWLLPLMIVINLCQSASSVVIAYFGTSDKILMPLCVFGGATTEQLVTILNVKDTTLLVISITVFLATIITVRVRLGKVKRDHGNVKEAKREMGTKVVWTLALMLTIYAVTVIAAAIHYNIMFTQNIEYQLRVAPVANTLQQISPVGDLLVFVLRHKDFRDAFFNLITLRKFNKVDGSGFESERRRSSVSELNRRRSSNISELKRQTKM